MLSLRAELLCKREQRESFHFAESSEESHCKTRLELATPALTSNAASLSFWGKVVLYQQSHFRIYFTNSAHFWLRSLYESKLPHLRTRNSTKHTQTKKDSRKLSSRAENEARTRDPNLGKVVLYQLSYFRVYFINSAFPAALIV